MNTEAPLHLDVAEAGETLERDLSTGQLRTLLAAAHLIELTPAAGGRWRIRGRRRVGLVRLGRGEDAVILHLRPKMPIANLLHLLSHTAGAEHWQDSQVDAGTDDHLLPAVARMFARTAKRALDQGVLHGYRTTADTLPTLRGRIDIPTQLRRCGMPLPIAVQYDEFTADIPENQILLRALLRLTTLAGLSASTHSLLRHLAARLTDITVPPPGSPLPPWTPNRLNTRYAPAVRLAELILADATPNLQPGAETPIDGVIIDMETVFEAFLTTALHTAIQPLGLRCASQEPHHTLDAARRVKLRPDITVYRGPNLFTFVDAKYKTTDGLGAHPDLYQLTAYCTALGLKHGHLVYASGPDVPATHGIGPAGTRVTVHALDLTAAPSTIDKAIDVLAHQLASTIA